MNDGSICPIVTNKSIGLAGMGERVMAGNILLGGNEQTLECCHPSNPCGLSLLGNNLL
jgi:hypothetical protein